MMTIKAVLFDLDQTLLDRTTSLKKFLNWQINFYQLVDSDLKNDFIQRFLVLDANGSVWKDRVYAQLIEEFQITHHSTEILLQSYIQDFNKFCTPFDGVKTTIEALYENGYKLGLISNGKSPFQEHNFYALGLKQYFSSIIVSEAVGLRKPDPRIFHLACEQLKIYPQDAIFVGDNWKVDIQGAQSAGLQALYFQGGELQHQPQATEKNIINNFSDVLKVIQTLRSQELESDED
ncbi:HAD family hydrolase [Acinetobacter sp. 194]|uniref:HAD family hydrolase n=1 Tax=Acinetobacter shaoyimingii TaxID=2715164 RepID=UPI00140AAFDF|nr:HAD family hydrolase [Acinetobacter shaoyimingii]NHB59266.1 HAD family hydrolase [Acinetobacter shaoyimingii]